MSEPSLDDLLNQYRAAPDIQISMPLPGPARKNLFLQARQRARNLSDTDPSAAQSIVDMMATAADQMGDSEVAACAEWCRGLFWYHREPFKALHCFEKAHGFYEQTAREEEQGRVLVGIAGIQALVGRITQAEQSLRQAIRVLEHCPEYTDWPAVYINLSDILGRKGDYPAMRIRAQQAEEMARQMNQPVMRGRALVNRSYAEMYLCQFEQAEQGLHEAGRVLTESYSPEVGGRLSVDLARIAVDRGRLFAALEYLEEAGRRFKEAQIEMEQAEVLVGKARLYERLKMEREARRAAAQSAMAFEQAGLPAESIHAALLVARLALSRGEAERARQYLGMAQRLVNADLPQYQAQIDAIGAHPLFQKDAAQRQNALRQADQAAGVLTEMNLMAEALEAFRMGAALSTALRQPDAASRYQQIVDEARRLGLVHIEIEALHGLAGLQPAKAAELSLQQAVTLTNQQRQQMPAQELKAHLLGGSAALYRRLIGLQLHSRQPENALRTLIEAKAGLWAELTAPAEQYQPDPAWVRARAELLEWQDRLKEVQQFDSQSEAAQIYRQHIAQAQEALTEADRRQARKRVILPLPTPQQVIDSLPAQSVGVEYLVGEKDILACVLRPGQPPVWVKTGTVSQVKPLLGQLSEVMTQASIADSDFYRQETVRILSILGQVLFHPLLPWMEKVERLWIAPDDWLFAMPWAALSCGGVFLGEQYELAILPSLALEWIGAQIANLPRPAPALALGCPGNPPLPAVQAELEAVWAAWPETCCVYPARRQDLRLQESPRLLHIATHGDLQREAPLLSSLQLADGDFLLAEALDLPLQGTRLVTLSACDTGVVPERGGILLALGGAFLSAGAQAVLSSLWRVDDTATVRLMASFYHALAAGETVSAALRRAQAALREQGQTHPYAWAAFQPLCRRFEVSLEK